jgi:hypothetical protein
MVVELNEAWSSHEDSTGEFALTLDATPENGVFFWEDVYPVEDETRVDGVPMTVDGLLDWIQKDPRIEATAPQRGQIGDLPATVLDVTISKGAKNEDPACPTNTCVLWLGFPQWQGSWGIAEPQVQRLYLSDVTYGARRISSLPSCTRMTQQTWKRSRRTARTSSRPSRSPRRLCDPFVSDATTGHRELAPHGEPAV